MKVKTVKYTIEEPCHEDWAKMKPEAKGRFCEACSKIVVDFSSMSDFSIVNYMTGKKNESVCGRFRPDQMEKNHSLSIPHRSFSFDLKAVALGLALTTFSAIHVNAQVIPIDTTQVIYEEPLDGMVVVREYYDHSDEKFASGTVSVNGKGYGAVTIQLMSESEKVIVQVMTDENGKFQILLDWNEKPSYLLVSGAGIFSEEYFLSTSESITDLKIRAYRNEPLILGFVKSR